MLAISTCGPEQAYQAGGSNRYGMSELAKPFQATAILPGMRFLPSFMLQGVRMLGEDQVRESAEEYINHITLSR
jgi:glutathione-regulated potassium-efflux system ancillary protein KefG